MYELYEDRGIAPEEGERFYTRLSDLAEVELAASGLPREELAEGLQQWRALTKENGYAQ